MDGLEDFTLLTLDALLAFVLVVVALVVHRLVYSVLERLVKRTHLDVDDLLVHLVGLRTRRPTRVLAVIAALALLLPWLTINDRDPETLRYVVLIGAILAVGWLLVSFTHVGRDLLEARLPMGGEDSGARALRTQVIILQRLAILLIVTLAVGLALLTIPGVQAVAASVLASAGIIGIVVGVAAGPVLGNIIAGVQIAFAQPIRIDDIVVMDGHWGRVREINSTHVVLHSWDGRQIVVPLSRIVDAPFENWTRRGSSLLATVTLHVDYSAPVDAIRAQLKKILDESGMWDGETWNLQVTDASERTLALRALMSAPDSSTAWDLRCHVREQLVTWIAHEHPAALPAVREIHASGTSRRDVSAT